MWDTPFDESILSAQPGVAIYCEDNQAAEGLFEIFKRNDLGKRWNAGVHGDRVYCVTGTRLQYGSKSAVEATRPFCNYIKCTFYGADTPDFEVASDGELTTLLGIGGV